MHTFLEPRARPDPSKYSYHYGYGHWQNGGPGSEIDYLAKKGSRKWPPKSDPEMVPLWGGQMSENTRKTKGFSVIFGSPGIQFGVAFQ